MSRENVEVIRRAYEAFNRGDFDAAMEIVHPEVEFARPGGQSSLRGADALRAWMEPDAFEKQVIEPLDFTVKRNKVLVHQHGWQRGAGSGIEIDGRAWVVWTLNDEGLVTRIEAFLDHQEAEALKAAGLSE